MAFGFETFDCFSRDSATDEVDKNVDSLSCTNEGG